MGCATNVIDFFLLLTRLIFFFLFFLHEECICVSKEDNVCVIYLLIASGTNFLFL